MVSTYSIFTWIVSPSWRQCWFSQMCFCLHWNYLYSWNDGIGAMERALSRPRLSNAWPDHRHSLPGGGMWQIVLALRENSLSSWWWTERYIGAVLPVCTFSSGSRVTLCIWEAPPTCQAGSHDWSLSGGEELPRATHQAKGSFSQSSDFPVTKRKHATHTHTGLSPLEIKNRRQYHAWNLLSRIVSNDVIVLCELLAVTVQALWYSQFLVFGHCQGERFPFMPSRATVFKVATPKISLKSVNGPFWSSSNCIGKETTSFSGVLLTISKLMNKAAGMV